ncbi:bet v i allergen [Colletotrichum asianum]|uniref:Bet v i allergen n=1 Tax=Colletotrichum asianum TaxID=702518 RepID=A0A8H3WMH9_9PEZI|nr:bet v i allergen [Colletotrichum asianum]
MPLEDLDERIVLASVTEIIQAPANEIWLFLSAIGAKRILIPGCTRSAVLEGYGENAIRRVSFGETFFDERILVCDHASYKLKYERSASTESKSCEGGACGGSTARHWGQGDQSHMGIRSYGASTRAWNEHQGASCRILSRANCILTKTQPGYNLFLREGYLTSPHCEFMMQRLSAAD